MPRTKEALRWAAGAGSPKQRLRSGNEQAESEGCLIGVGWDRVENNHFGRPACPLNEWFLGNAMQYVNIATTGRSLPICQS